ncbi:MAG TPA: tetratricopeptide repeat protein [Chthonomonas sp.]|uniref:tetratricopeptide repeat protein n=1 Tax=Chthonomonas sp. TaxID=2282153 RepID=UPI002B4B62DF|nr:tetratricopeptide repeat protein [Chthonomonas sp.]HLI49995.1 tetratricopeptide repeat protein [Chthonomonas sp.]
MENLLKPSLQVRVSRRTRLLFGLLLILLGIYAVPRLQHLLQLRALQNASEQELQEMAQKDPHNYDVQHLLGKRAQEIGDYHTAMQAYWQAVQLRPTSETDWLGWAQNATYVKGPIGGQMILLAYLKQFPHSVPALVQLAKVYMLWNYPASAQEYAQRALHLQPSNFEALILLGQAQLQQADYAHAEATFKQAQQLRSADWRPLTGLGEALLHECRYMDAIPVLERATRAAPNQPAPLLDLGQCYAKRSTTPQDANQARQYLHAALLHEDLMSPPQLFATLQTLGELDLQQGRPQASLNWLLRAQKLEPANPQIQFDLAHAYTALGNHKLASIAMSRHQQLLVYQLQIKQLSAQIAATPNNPALRLRLARLYASHGDVVDASREYAYLLSHHQEEKQAQHELQAILPDHPSDLAQP